MRTQLVIVSALMATGCAYQAPSGPSDTADGAIVVSPCPATTTGVDLNFYREIGCHALEGPTTAVRRWAVAPKLYIRTIDDAGAPIDLVTLDTAATAMASMAAIWMGGRFGLASIERGTETRDRQAGWITVTWPGADTPLVCGHATVAVDGGSIELNHHGAFCGCGDSRISARVAKHELGHALGYWHTDSTNDLMYPASGYCDQPPSARELAAANYQYR